MHYPEAWAIPLMLLAILLFIGVAVLGFRSRHLTWRGIGSSHLLWLGSKFVAIVLAHFAWLLLRSTSLANLLPYRMAYNGDLYAYGFIALTVAILCALYGALGRRTRTGDLAVGGLLWWVILTVLTSLFLKGASYMFVWPLLASLAALGYTFTRRNPEAKEQSALVWALPAIFGILLFAVLPYLLVMLVSTTAVTLLVIVTALLLGLLVPNIHIMTAHRRWLLPGAALATSLALFVTAMSRRGYDAAHPRADSLLYALDADTGKAVWASSDKAPDVWTSQFLGTRLHSGDLGRFSYWLRNIREADAPSISVEAPNAVVTDDLTLGDVRAIRLYISSRRRAGVIWTTIENARVLEASVNGKKIAVPAAGPTGGTDHWSLVNVAAPEDGFVLTLQVPASQTPVLTVADETEGLPDAAKRDGRPFRPRPDDIMPSPRWNWLDSSLLVGSLSGSTPTRPCSTGERIERIDGLADCWIDGILQSEILAPL